METRTETWRLTIRQADGDPLITLLFDCERIKPQEKPATTAPAVPASTWRPTSESVIRDGDRPMTEPQRRYLFRMLAQQGLDGPQAEQHLKNHCKVPNIHAITRAAASQLIEQMLADRMEGRDGNA